MAQSKLEQHSVRALKASKAQEPVPSAVFLPPALREQPNVVYAFTGELPDVKQNIVRIQEECDPVGMLIAIAMGMPVATHSVKKNADGEWEVTTKYDTIPLDNPIRERIIKHLADKVIPRISVRATQGKKGSAKPEGAEWEATLGAAAEKDDAE